MMLYYLLKSASCLLLFLAFYQLFLESLSYHTFKRFFLLLVLPASFLIPLVTFYEFLEPQVIVGNETMVGYSGSTMVEPTQYPLTNDYLPAITASIYTLGVALMLFRMIMNLVRIYRQIQDSEKVTCAKLTHVLMKKKSRLIAFLGTYFIINPIMKPDVSLRR